MPCPCRAPSMSLCKRLLKDVSRQPVGDLPSFGFFRLPRGVSRLAVRIFPATSGYSPTTRHYWRTAWVRHGMCELQRHATAVARHGIRELAFMVTDGRTLNQPCFTAWRDIAATASQPAGPSQTVITSKTQSLDWKRGAYMRARVCGLAKSDESSRLIYFVSPIVTKVTCSSWSRETHRTKLRTLSTPAVYVAWYLRAVTRATKNQSSSSKYLHYFHDTARMWVHDMKYPRWLRVQNDFKLH